MYLVKKVNVSSANSGICKISSVELIVTNGFNDFTVVLGPLQRKEVKVQNPHETKKKHNTKYYYKLYPTSR